MSTTKDFMGYTVIATGENEGRYATAEVAMQAYVDECCSWISDASKDAQGFRYRIDPTNLTFADLDAECDYWSQAASTAIDEEKVREAEYVEEFKALVQRTIELGARDEETALRWLTTNEEFYSSQCVEGWVYSQGILFTDYGKALVERLRTIVTYKEVA